MKKIKVLFLIVFTSLFFASNASELKSEVHVKVKGMVCSFCSTGVEKVFKKQDAVEDIKVDMDKKIVSITFKKEKNMDDKTIIGLITDSGYNVDSITRSKKETSK